MKSFPTLLILLFFGGCHLFQRTPTTAPVIDRVIQARFPGGRDEFNRTPESYEARAAHGMISSEGEPATEIALDVLKRGGNAVDAAVALSFAIGVYRPHSTGIGGGGFMIVYDERSAKAEVLDMRERAPLRSSRDMYLDKSGDVTDKSRWGGLAVATPGLVAGLWEAFQKRGSGKITWKELVLPSAKLAREGFAVDPDMAEAIEWTADKGLLEKFPSAKKLLAPNGKLLKQGDLYQNPNLAKTLETIAEKGKDGFYKGWVAQDIVAAVKKDGGILEQKDLDRYELRYLDPVKADFGEFTVLSMPPPSSGGVHIVEMLNMAETLIRDIDLESVSNWHLKAEIMRRAFADRSKYLGDPSFFKVPVSGLTSEEYAQQLTKGIDRSKASKSVEVQPGQPAPYEKIHTTHFSIVDDNGLAVASTQTINYLFGAVLVAGASGVFLNDEMDDFSAKPGAPNLFGLVGGEANAIAPLKTPLSSMSPTVVTKEGKIYLVLGSPGGSKIITSVWNVLFNVLHHKLTLRDAIFAPRMHHQWLPDKLVTEPGWETATLQGLRDKGHEIEELKTPSLGSVTAVMVEPGGGKIGVADPRRGGAAAGY
ncbi:MAG: gamma-glutamyltransferase [Bdellovibrionales bacterium]|nr:gamma-glutamyltransferase [Bdellovibrionales bacterium]